MTSRRSDNFHPLITFVQGQESRMQVTSSKKKKGSRKVSGESRIRHY